MRARRLGAIVWMLLGACSWHRNELALPYQPSPLPRVRTRTPVLDDNTRKHLWLGDMVHVVRGCNLPPDSLPQTPVKLRGLCVIEANPQSDP
jgi:hypothetical protein